MIDDYSDSEAKVPRERSPVETLFRDMALEGAMRQNDALRSALRGLVDQYVKRCRECDGWAYWECGWEGRESRYFCHAHRRFPATAYFGENEAMKEALRLLGYGTEGTK